MHRNGGGAKGNNKVYIYVDLTHLNKSVCREAPLLAVEQLLVQLAGARVFLTLVCQLGVLTDTTGQKEHILMTIINPFGIYCFTVYHLASLPSQKISRDECLMSSPALRGLLV